MTASKQEALTFCFASGENLPSSHQGAATTNTAGAGRAAEGPRSHPPRATAATPRPAAGRQEEGPRPQGLPAADSASQRARPQASPEGQPALGGRLSGTPRRRRACGAVLTGAGGEEEDEEEEDEEEASWRCLYRLFVV